MHCHISFSLSFSFLEELFSNIYVDPRETVGQEPSRCLYLVSSLLLSCSSFLCIRSWFSTESSPFRWLSRRVVSSSRASFRFRSRDRDSWHFTHSPAAHTRCDCVVGTEVTGILDHLEKSGYINNNVRRFFAHIWIWLDSDPENGSYVSEMHGTYLSTVCLFKKRHA